MKEFNVAIIGGGASALALAAFLSARSVKGVAVLERGDRVGKKLSATGNGQGNITNAAMSKEHYFSDEIDKAWRIIESFDEKALVAFLEGLGGLFLTDGAGRVYPASKQASSVTDLLRGYVDGKVTLITGFKAERVKKSGSGFSVRSADGEEIFARRVVVACGGKAQKNFGTDGNFYEAIKALGHTVTPLYPSLVQIKTETAHIKTLKGIRADAVVTAVKNGKKLGSSRGDLIFTEYGISGNAVFYLSPRVTGLEGVTVSVEFLPDVEKSRLTELIAAKQARRPDIERRELLSCFLNNQIGRAIMKRVKGNSAAEIASAVKNFTLPVTGTLGFDYAQVTKGGIPLSEVTGKLESKAVKGLYFTGEILNVDGECGGYNLQWAFSSAHAVAEALVK